MKSEKYNPEVHYKMSKQTKIIAAGIADAHERGRWLRQMKEAEMAAEAYKRKPLKGNKNKDRDEDE